MWVPLMLAVQCVVDLVLLVDKRRRRGKQAELSESPFWDPQFCCRNSWLPAEGVSSPA